MKTPRVNLVVKCGLSLLFAFAVYVGVAQRAVAAESEWLPSDSEIAMVLSDYGWVGAGDGMEIQRTTLHFDAPYAGVWVRFAEGDRYGDWTYANMMINCEDFSSLAYAYLYEGRAITFESLTGKKPEYKVWQAGSDNARVNIGICQLYGYTKQTVQR